MAETILVAENHSYLRSALRAWLETTFPDCRILEATSENEVMALVEASLPRVIIIDISMFQTGGLEAVSRIKTALPGIPVVILTNYKDEQNHTHSMAEGTGAYVWKNELAGKLESTLAALLRPRHEVSGGGKRRPPTGKP